MELNVVFIKYLDSDKDGYMWYLVGTGTLIARGVNVVLGEKWGLGIKW